MRSISKIADSFYRAFREREWHPPDKCFDITLLTIAEAYEVQETVAQKRISSGEKTVGYKVGCTSTAIRKQFGLSEPICAPIFEPRVFPQGVNLDVNDFIIRTKKARN